MFTSLYMSYFAKHNGPGGGNFWYGTHGFLFKKKQSGGVRKNPAYGLMCGRPKIIWNKYISGAGVGASNISTRRAKARMATACMHGQRCFFAPPNTK
jgi:hypothetical protein